MRWTKQLLFAVLGAAAVVLGILGLQERTLSQAATALEKGDTNYAMYLVTRILQWNPGNTRALAIQARGMVAEGYAEDAIQIFENIGAASPADLHALAKAYMLKEDWSSALPLLGRVRQMTPDDADLIYEMASCQMRLGQFDDALKNSQMFTETPGHFARGNLLTGSIYGAMRKNEEAAKAFELVLEKEPDAKNLQIPPHEFFLRFGRILMELGKPKEALPPLKRSAAEQATAEVFVLLGDAASQLGNSKNATVAWKRAVEVDPRNAGARASLANAALVAGDGKQALEWLEPLRDGKLTSSIAYLFQRTFTLLGNDSEKAAWQAKAAELRHEENVISVLDNSLIANPNAFWSRATQAYYFASEGNWGQAEAIVSQLIAEQPGDPYIIELADAVRRKGKLPNLSRIPVVQY